LLKLMVMAQTGIIKISTNKKAYHNYSVLETYEAGIALFGYEVKSLRQKEVSLEGSFIRTEKGQAFLHNMHIKPYKFHSLGTIDPTRTRKLLLKSKEIKRLADDVQIKSHTLIPLEIYFKGGWAKIKIGVCRGKKLFDKRDALTKKDVKRQLERDFKNKHRI